MLLHDEVSVDSFKDGVLLRPGYWDEKTKAPFLWGRGEGNAAEWIGFVGYELRSNGEVSLRRSTLEKQFARICFRHKKIMHINETIRSSKKEAGST